MAGRHKAILQREVMGLPVWGWLLAALTALLTVVAVVGLLMFHAAQDDIDALQARVSQQAGAAQANARGLASANSRIVSLGGRPVPTPSPGPQGLPGAQGPTGAAGSQGVAGPVGATGAPGEPGPPGAEGSPGPAGASGASGSNGADGASGPSGPSGPAGPSGAKGDQGDTGPQGSPGPACPSGYTPQQVTVLTVGGPQDAIVCEPGG